MKLLLLLVFAFIFTFAAFSQEIAPDTYVIKFIDKDSSLYSIDNPSNFLSERAIKRRQKYNIPVIEQDIPVNISYVNQIKILGFEIYAVSKWMNHIVVYSKDSTLFETASKLDFVNSNPLVLCDTEKAKKKIKV